MRRIIRRRDIIVDDWRYEGDEGGAQAAATVDGSSSARRVVPLADLNAALAAGTAPAAGAGVSIGPTDEVDKLAPLLSRVALIVVDFPKVGEGRGFSQARILRQRLGFNGELRARGALKRDQLFLLARCGFDAFDLDPAEDLDAALAAFNSFSVGYQSRDDWGMQLRARRA